MQRLKSFMLQSRRVWKLLRKPSSEEFKTITKVSALGILVLGAAGFVIATLMEIF
ncbi:protein translocase SEC61 complex subunit gamma [Candidatus Pacearchaeota archaeon CG_4_9_14_0_2_um_filter_39_13]|nr:protein translocase SEC61 complex subunit gamma [Candidatus Pacearchaeota archaeon]OIO44096.1 MAG: protein translocase SEC61 complex subunit gamma [Candidatus Pacearchaeota archaeon CG1_02_39_14]PJC44386.1 MAG: protein translocase SEC61 complex subunit gamma [Candidatus Pacearchaeota archaeon CG_4_9_14_0_2_um_filter_39_13]